MENGKRGSKFSYTCHTLKLDPVTLPIDMAVTQIATCCEKIIKQGDVLLVGSASPEYVIKFWQDLRQKIGSKRFDNRLVIIMATNSQCNLPEDIILLPSPQCEEADIHDWVRQFIESKGLSENIIGPLTNKMICNCSDGNQLNMLLVYMHIPQVIKDPCGYCS